MTYPPSPLPPTSPATLAPSASLPPGPAPAGAPAPSPYAAALSKALFALAEGRPGAGLHFFATLLRIAFIPLRALLLAYCRRGGVPHSHGALFDAAMAGLALYKRLVHTHNTRPDLFTPGQFRYLIHAAHPLSRLIGQPVDFSPLLRRFPPRTSSSCSCSNPPAVNQPAAPSPINLQSQIFNLQSHNPPSPTAPANPPPGIEHLTFDIGHWSKPARPPRQPALGVALNLSLPLPRPLCYPVFRQYSMGWSRTLPYVPAIEPAPR